jgi:hypothetical protein
MKWRRLMLRCPRNGVLLDSGHRARDGAARYTKTSDGVSIGYSVTGTGVPLLFSFPIGHQILMAESPVLRPWFEGLARRFQLVVFDSRGTGLSQRDVTWSPEAFALESMPEPLHVRVGLNAGEPIEEDGDLFGAKVILASRIAAKAGPGDPGVGNGAGCYRAKASCSATAASSCRRGSTRA